MKTQLLLTSIMGMLLMTGSVYAGPEKGKPYSNNTDNGNHYAFGHFRVRAQGGSNQGGGSPSAGNSGGSSSYNAPEIDAASGGSAIALLTGVLLLAGEKVRSKRTQDKSGINEV